MRQVEEISNNEYRYVYQISNNEYRYVYHVCHVTQSHSTADNDGTTAKRNGEVRYIAVQNSATVIARCPYCGMRVA